VLARLRTSSGDLGAAVSELARIPAENARHKPKPPAEGLVLDVGGGQAAHPRADVVVDKYVVDDFERAGALELTKPLVVADGHRLPFANASFDYVIAMHVLEHATDPVRFAAELSRVAKAGFVQLPSAESELTFGWPFHPWLIDLDGDTLVFKPKGERRAPFGEFFHESYLRSALMRLWFASERSRWHHSVEWQGEIHVRVEGESAAEQTAALDVERTLMALSQLADSGRLVPLTPALRAVLRCPDCGEALEASSDEFACSECGRRYPVVGDVPVLLEEAVRA
jgi:SAM-dependent methyltransferase